MTRARRWLITTTIAMAVILGTSAPALASSPNEHASCVGILTWANTHHVEGFPTRADLAHSVKSVTAGLGLPPGAFFSLAAGLQLGSIASCNAALP